MSYTLLTRDVDFTAQRIQIAAAYAGVDMKVSNIKNPMEFKKLTGFTAGPVLQTKIGPIFGVNAIVKYFADVYPASRLAGGCMGQKITVAQYIELATGVIEPARQTWLGPIISKQVYDAKAYANAKKEVTAALSGLNTVLETRTYLVGNSITAADIAVCTALIDLLTTVVSPTVLAKSPHFVRYFNTVVNQPLIAPIVGEIVFATAEKKAVLPKKEAAKPAKAAAAAPKVAEKPKDPRTLLAPTTMNLDAEKKSYFSQVPYDAEFFATFWDRFDASGYSIYISDYNFNSDNKEYWRTQNAMGGFIQRCDPIRKYAFGTMFIHGNTEENPPFSITGCWIFRGPVVHQEILDGDGEWYTWTKQDSADTKVREMVKEMFMAPKYKGENVLDRRYMK